MTRFEQLEEKFRILESAKNRSNMKIEYDSLLYKMREQILNLSIEQAQEKVK